LLAPLTPAAAAAADSKVADQLALVARLLYCSWLLLLLVAAAAAASAASAVRL
jgi:hypothetical protein